MCLFKNIQAKISNFKTMSVKIKNEFKNEFQIFPIFINYSKREA